MLNIDPSKLTKEQSKQLYALISNPAVFGEAFLKDPTDGKSKMKLRFYQHELLDQKNRKKVIRMARRTGKTVAMVVEIIWKAFTFDDKQILVVTPYQSQIEVIFDFIEKMIKDVPDLEQSCKIKRSPFYKIEWGNGSIIKGFTAGTRSGQAAQSIRGQDATDIYLDEVDYMGSSAINAIMAIETSRPDVAVWASSTPSGKREQFYLWATNKKLGYKEFHYTSAVLPHWSPQLQEARRAECADENQFLQEYMAEWGHEAFGVYAADLVDRSLRDYRYLPFVSYSGKKYQGCIAEKDPGNIYMMGVDWNEEKAGTRLVIWEYIRNHPDRSLVGKLRVFYHENVSDEIKKIKNIKHQHNIEVTKRVIALAEKYNCSSVYLDKGHGHTNFELILSWYKRQGRLAEAKARYKVIDFGEIIQIRTADGRLEDKYAKEFMVGSAVKFFEQDMLVFPEFEDERYSLVGQFREFVVEKIGASGRRKYTDNNEDSHTAAILGLHAFVLEYSELSPKLVSTTGIGYAKGLRDYPTRGSATSEEETTIPGVQKRGPALKEIATKHGLSYSYSRDPRDKDDRIGGSSVDRSKVSRAMRRVARPARTFTGNSRRGF